MIPFALLACAPTPADSDTDAAVDLAPPLGAPIEAAPEAWTWVDVEGTSCDDGSPTGIAVNPGTTNDLLFLFNGGGACWDYTTCIDLHTASTGPFGAAQWRGWERGFGGTVLDRDDPENPFATWTYVFVPYCTGDLHGGDHVVTYTRGEDSAEYAHVGHTNVLRDLERIGATWTAPDRVAVSGLSAGGGGVLINYATVRWYYPDAKSYLLDDSLPMFIGDALQPWMRETWIETWNLHPVIDPVCSDCADDFSKLHAALSTKYPNDRMALLSSLQDATISGYYLMSGPSFQANLEALDRDVLADAPPWNRYFVSGDSHTMLGDPGDFETSDGAKLWPWLTAMISDDAAWTDVGP